MPRPRSSSSSSHHRPKHIHVDDSPNSPPAKKAKKYRAPSIQWGKVSNYDLTWSLIEAMDDPAMRHQLFSDDRKEAKRQRRNVTTGSVTKVVLHGRLAKAIFEWHPVYKDDYDAHPASFMSSVTNRLIR